MKVHVENKTIAGTVHMTALSLEEVEQIETGQQTGIRGKRESMKETDIEMEGQVSMMNVIDETRVHLRHHPILLGTLETSRTVTPMATATEDEAAQD